MANTTITSNVLDSISKRIQNVGFSKDNRKALLLFNGSTINLDENLKSLQELQKKGYSVSVGYSFMAEKIIDTKKISNMLHPVETFKEEDVFKLQSIVGNYSLLILPNITINTLSKVALGMIDSFVPTIIWTFLYGGKSVYMDFTGVRNYLGKQSKSPEIDRLTNGYISTVLKMGAKEIVSKNYLNTLNLNNNTNLPIKTSEKESIKRGLITEKDILKLSHLEKELHIEKGTVITPLAKDKARELGINIKIN